jgi:hypothetical protein
MGFEPTIPVLVRSKRVHALNRAVTVRDMKVTAVIKYTEVNNYNNEDNHQYHNGNVKPIGLIVLTSGLHWISAAVLKLVL